uniref:Uncharacterized protein n=1 Tax=Electrophorus electricus TaxID=8005 RepID=A0AAY5EC08_ELEEL
MKILAHNHCYSLIKFSYIYINSLFNGKKPVHVIVNCWFCNQNTEVPYGNRNCWDCPFCVQMVIITNRSLHNIWSTSTMGYQLVSLCLMHPRLNQTLKIKQLASFTPREEVGFPFELTITMEIEVYKRHLEQTYELCTNRQLRALLFNHQLRCSQDADKAFIKVTLRSLAFLTCAFLVAVAICGSGSKANSITKTMQMWNDLVGLLPERGNREYQMAVASVGLLTSINIYSGSKKKWCTGRLMFLIALCLQLHQSGFVLQYVQSLLSHTVHMSLDSSCWFFMSVNVKNQTFLLGFKQ